MGILKAVFTFISIYLLDRLDQFSCWNPTNGDLLHTIHVPVERVTSCAFGGPDLQTIYITTANSGERSFSTPASEYAGDLFSIRLDVKGVPAFRFAG